MNETVDEKIDGELKNECHPGALVALAYILWWQESDDAEIKKEALKQIIESESKEGKGVASFIMKVLNRIEKRAYKGNECELMGVAWLLFSIDNFKELEVDRTLPAALFKH